MDAYWKTVNVLTGMMPRSGKLPVLNLLTGQKSGFSPRRGDSLYRFRSNFAGLTGTWVRLAAQNFTSIAPGGWEYGLKNIKNFQNCISHFRFRTCVHCSTLFVFCQLSVLHFHAYVVCVPSPILSVFSHSSVQHLHLDVFCVVSFEPVHVCETLCR